MSFPSFTIASSTRIDPQLGAASSPFGSMLGRAATGLLGTGSPWSVSDLVPAAANRMGMPDGDAAQFFLNQPGALQSVLGQDGFLQQQRLQAMSLGQLSAPPTGAIPGVYPQEPSTATEGDLAAATRTLLKHMGEGKDKRMSVEQLQQCAASGNSEVSQAARTLLSNPQHLQKVLDEGGNLTHESARKGALSPEEAQAAKKIVEWFKENFSGGPPGMLAGINLTRLMEKGDVPPHIKDAFAVLKGGAMDYIDGVETHGERDGNANFHNFQNALTGLI